MQPVAAPPQSLDAERTVLGALIRDPEKMFEVAPVLEPDDFYDPVLGSIYKALKQLYDGRAPIDFVTIGETLGKNKKVQGIGGVGFLAQLAEEVPTSSHAKHHAEIVREKSLRRQVGKIGSKLTDLANADDKSADELAEIAQQEILKLSRQSRESKPTLLKETASDRYDYYTSLHEAEDTTPYRGILTGFSTLDDMLTGLEPSHFMIVAGRPSMGKTAFALNVAHNVAAAGKSVSVFSLEMSKEQLTDRTIATALGVESSILRRGLLDEEEFQRLGHVIDNLNKQRIFIDDDPDTTVTNLRSKARRQQMEHGLDLLIIDYLTLIDVTDRAANENQTQRISYISKSLKHLARELDCPIMALSQLNRSCEQRVPPIPYLADLRDSGSIEQDADSVLMLYRQGYYDEFCDNPNVTDIYVRKNRHGATGSVPLYFDKKTTHFTSLSSHSG